jgi:RNase H-fold protein (predicted Holliday junction resolvase)
VKENKKIEIFGWDERNSTKLVEEKYKFFKSKIGKKIKIDSLAAKIILDNFLFFWKNSTL